jgi:outer membrane protein insertion porin family
LPWTTRLPVLTTAAAFVAALLLFATAVGAQAPAPGGVIEDIVIEGSQRIEPATVETYLTVRRGDPFDPVELERSLTSLFRTGLFADVVLRQEGGNLVVTVVENPIINRIAFEGNQRLEDEELLDEVQLRPRVVYTRTRVQNDVARILELYRRSGRFAATVEPQVIQLPQNRVDLVFEIDEGPLTGVQRISFVGNEAFSDSTLRGEILTTESRWWRFLATNDTYDPDRLAADRDLLRRFYLSEGYADFRVISAVAELTPDNEEFFVTFTIDEGERYEFGTIGVTSQLPDLDVEQLRPLIESEEGDWYSSDAIEASIDALTDAAADQQFAFVDVQPRITRDRDERLINVTYEIGEGPRVFVERIDISGNVRTVDSVIRREMELVEGDPFNQSLLRRSERNIGNLGFFRSVEVTAVPGSTPDRTVIQVVVEEQSTGELSLGGGFSTIDGPLGSVTLLERNLLGRGQTLRLTALISGTTQEFDLSFTEPYFLGLDMSAGFDAFRITRDNQDESSFDEESTGFGLRFGYRLAEDWTQTLQYRLDYRDISDVDANASRFVRDQEGTTLQSAVGHLTVLDRRDSRIEPTEGYIVRFGNEVSGLGGDVHYFRTSVNGAYYYPLFEGTVLSLSAEGGHIIGLGEDVRINDRFFVGGSNLRGFERAGIGPRDLTTDDALGGNIYGVGTVEVSFPLGLPEELGIRGRAFTDFGTLTDVDDDGAEVVDEGSLRASVGVGISWRSPLGPIRIDFSEPVLKEDFDRTENIRFSFGTQF